MWGNKKKLSDQNEAKINIAYIEGKKNIVLDITLADFENICKSLFDRCTKPLKDAITVANITMN